MMNTVNSPTPFKKQPLFMGLASSHIDPSPSFQSPSVSNISQFKARTEVRSPFSTLPGGVSSQSLWSLNPSLLFEGARKKSVNAVEAAKEPLLAEDVVLNKVKYPVYMSPKVDGNRGMVQDGKILGRGLVPIPNPFVQELLGNPLLEGFDGELISGKPNEKVGLLDQTNSLLRQQKHAEGPLGFYVFDIMNEPDKTYAERLALLKERIQKLPAALKKYVKLMPQELVYSEADVKKKEAKFLADGYEGAILRSPDAKYKNKRATMGDQALMKLKQFKDAEGIMVDCYPLLPSNTAGKTILKNKVMTRQEMLALTEETQGAAGYVVKDIKSQTEFHLSAPPMSLDERRLLWKNRGKLKGKVIKYKFFPYGSDPDKMVPRHATMIGFREDFDLPTELKGMAKKFKLIKPDAPNTDVA